MLNPCHPCMWPKAPCEQCMFGYRSLEENHELMKKIILNALAGNCTDYRNLADRYAQAHKNWREEMELTEEEKMTIKDYQGPTMSVKDYQLKASRTINKDLSRHEQSLHALFGMASEIGELHGIYQKMYQGHDYEQEHMQKEVGDLLWFIAEYCTSQGWELEKIMKMNIRKLEERYPEGFDAEHSLHRKDGDI